MFSTIGPLEIGIIALVVILLFGVGKISRLGGDLGSSIKEFRKAVKDEDKDDDKTKLQATQAPAPPPQPQYQQPPQQYAPPPPAQYQQPAPPPPPQQQPVAPQGDSKSIF